HFRDRMRANAPEAISNLKRMGCAIEVLSGDNESRVHELAKALGLAHTARVSPREKTARIAAMAPSGHNVLMVGDGLNDPPPVAARGWQQGLCGPVGRRRCRMERLRFCFPA